MAKASSSTGVSATWSTKPANPVFGQAVTLTATVVAATPSTAGPPTSGTVSFYDGGTLLGTPQAVTNLNNGMVTLTTNLPVASHTITAVFSGYNSLRPDRQFQTSPLMSIVVQTPPPLPSP